MMMNWEIETPLEYLGFAYFVFKEWISSYFQ
jgi:hypothetical protein